MALVKIVKRDDGLWLISESNLLQDFKGKAIFLTSIPYYLGILPRSWACWDSFQWIGPRHTNYPDGSVCAFEQSDGSWLPGESVVELLDMYTLWALRHLHLSILGRWPGQQRVHTSYERISELAENELCGCDKPMGLYKDCCQNSDASINHIAMATIFNLRNGGLRKPQLCFEENINNHTMLPNISEVCF